MYEDFLNDTSLLLSILGQTTDGIIVAGADQKILFLNPAGSSITGWRNEEASGADLMQIFNVRNEVYQSELAYIHKKILLPPHVYEGHTLLVTNGGKEVHLEIKVCMNTGSNGKKYWYYIFKSVDSERLREYEAKETSRKYEKLFDMVSEAIVIFNDTGNITEANPAACGLFGLDSGEMQHIKITGLFTDKDAQEAELLWNDFIKYGAIEYDFKYTNHAGKTKHLHFKAKSNFQLNLHVAIFEDITKLTKVLKSLSIQEAALAVFVKHADQPFIYLTSKFKIVAASTAAADLVSKHFGVSLAPDANVCDALPPEVCSTFKASFEHFDSEEALEKDLVIHNTTLHCKITRVVSRLKTKGYLIFLSAIPVAHQVEPFKATSLTSVMNERHFRNLAENSPDIIYIINLHERRVTYFNREYIFGYPANELQHTEGWIKMVHPEDIKKVKNHWAKFLKHSTGTVAIEYRLQRKDLQYEWVINRHTVIERDHSALPVSVLLYITVITERRRTDEALRGSEARLMALIENTSDILWSVDQKLNVTALNTSFRNLFKLYYKKSIEVGNNLYEVLPAKANLEWMQNHQRALAGERFTTEFNITGKHSGFYEVSYNPIFNEEGQVNGVSVFGRDITLRKSAENDIIRTNFELDSFVYRASHDLRAPLRSVLGLVNIVKTEENSVQRNMYLNLVDKSINKLDTFIADLTNFSRNSRLEVAVEKINFTNIIHDCVDNLKYMENAEIIDRRISVIDKYEFWSDPGRIIIILQNLLSNAIKYRNPNNESCYVIIRVETFKNHCQIIMTDNGKGIKEEYIEKVFNMFFRASHDSYGSGLGLYITKQVVEKLSGKISVSSSLGKGSTFEIKLPNLL